MIEPSGVADHEPHDEVRSVVLRPRWRVGDRVESAVGLTRHGAVAEVAYDETVRAYQYRVSWDDGGQDLDWRDELTTRSAQS